MEKVKDEFQPATWQAFWETAVEGKPAAEVGTGLKMTPGAVYVARSRVPAPYRGLAEDHVRAARLLAATDGAFAKLGQVPDPDDAQQLAHVRAAAVVALGEERFAAEFPRPITDSAPKSP